MHRNSVPKAYQFVSELGIVTTIQVRGTFVADLTICLICNDLLDLLKVSLERNSRHVRHISVSREEIESTIGSTLESEYETKLPRDLFDKMQHA
jgi:DNA-binding transcriptional regulator YhcF (GntR family)